MVPFQRSSYPTVTFPNHFSIATGKYTEAHGIIDNGFNDLELQDYYNAFDFDHAVSPEWYQAEPIWNTATRQGKKSAAYMWPSADLPVNNKFPTYNYNFLFYGGCAVDCFLAIGREASSPSQEVVWHITHVKPQIAIFTCFSGQIK